VASDVLTRKLFGFGLFALMGVGTYFQADGAASLLGASLGPATTPRILRAAASGNQGVAAKRSADPILDRNPFDSVTGPLTRKALVLAAPPKTEPNSPLSAPTCEGIRLAIVSESPDPAWSLAALQGPGEAGPQMRRVGETVGGKQIAYIGYNPLSRSPAVWMQSGSTLCQSVLFAVQPPVAAASAASAAAGAAGPGAIPDPPRRGPTKVPPEILAKIQKVSETEFLIDRTVIDQIIERQAELMRARIVPDQQNGQVVGLRLYGVRPDTVLGALGLENGDRLETINGFSMASPEKALEVYARLRSADGLKIQLNRRGKPLSIDYKIK
jgi:general secretion pathway protein C